MDLPVAATPPAHRGASFRPESRERDIQAARGDPLIERAEAIILAFALQLPMQRILHVQTTNSGEVGKFRPFPGTGWHARASQQAFRGLPDHPRTAVMLRSRKLARGDDRTFWCDRMHLDVTMGGSGNTEITSPVRW